MVLAGCAIGVASAVALGSVAAAVLFSIEPRGSADSFGSADCARTALHLAAMNGESDKVALLLQSAPRSLAHEGASINFARPRKSAFTVGVVRAHAHQLGMPSFRVVPSVR